MEQPSDDRLRQLLLLSEWLLYLRRDLLRHRNADSERCMVNHADWKSCGGE